MSATLSPQVRDLLRQAEEWRLMGLLFERPYGAWWLQVESLAEGRGDDDLKGAADAAREADEGTYLALLGPGGPVSAREVGHRPTADPGHLLATLAAYYRAFAFEPLTEEPLDHVSVEAGFLGYLRLKEAFALAHGDEEAARVTAEAAARFLEEHLSALAEPLALGLEACAGSYLALAARALFRSVGPRRLQEGGWAPEGLEDWNCGYACGLESGTEPAGHRREIP